MSWSPAFVPRLATGGHLISKKDLELSRHQNLFYGQVLPAPTPTIALFIPFLLFLLKKLLQSLGTVLTSYIPVVLPPLCCTWLWRRQLPGRPSGLGWSHLCPNSCWVTGTAR